MKPHYKAYRFENKAQFNRLVEIYGKGFFSYVPNLDKYNGDIAEGYLYGKSDPSGTWSGFCNREYFQKELMNWNYQRVEVLPEEWETTPQSNIDADLYKAKLLLRKTVRHKIQPTYVGKVKDFRLFLEKSGATPITVDEAIDKNGYSIGVYYGEYVADINSLDIVPDSVKVKLNNKYEAEVNKDKIVVGCQTFEVSKIEELAAALKSLQ